MVEAQESRQAEELAEGFGEVVHLERRSACLPEVKVTVGQQQLWVNLIWRETLALTQAVYDALEGLGIICQE